MAETPQDPADAHQCYEALKLLQASFPASSGGGGGDESEAAAAGWCPSTEEDFAVLMECLQRTRPEEEDEEEGGTIATQFPQWVTVTVTHGEKCKTFQKTPVVKTTRSDTSLSKCRAVHGCRTQESVSPYFHLLLQFFVQVMTENARALRPEQYRSSAVMEMLMPHGHCSNWTAVAVIVMEGIGSRVLPRHVSDTYFALLHLLVDVCGSPAHPEFESTAFVWLSGTGIAALEAASGNSVNDSLAELLQRSKLHSMKLQLVNAMLMTRFDSSELSKKHGDLLKDLHSKSKLGERLVHLYFHLKAKTGLQGSDTRTFDNESLVIFVTSAWQSAKALQHEMPQLWEYLMQNADLIRSGFATFQERIDRLSRMRGAAKGETERVVLYMALLKALIDQLCGGGGAARGGQSPQKRLRL